MSSFIRALHMAWSYRLRFGLSVICALLVAVLWSGNLSAVYPILKIFFDKQTLQTWIDSEIDKDRNQLDDLLHQIKVCKVDLESVQRGVTSERAPVNLITLTETMSRLERDRNRALWQLHSHERLQPFIHHYVPNDRGRTLVVVMVLLVVTLALKGFFVFCNESLVGGVTQLTMFDLRNALHRHTMKMDLAALHQAGSSELMTRFTNDVETLAVGLETLIGKVIREPLKALSCIGLACWVNWRLTLVVLALVPVAVVLISTIGRNMKRATRRYLESMSSIYRILQEGLQGIKIVKGFTAEPQERRRFFQETKNYFHKAMRIVRLEALTSPVTELVGVCAIATAVLLGAFLVIGENDYDRTHVLGIRMADAPMDPVALATLYTLLAGVSDPVRKLSSVYGRIQRAAAACDRIFGFLDQQPAIVDCPQMPWLARHEHAIEFKQTHFGYPGSGPALADINLQIRFGETVAIVGPNGCGKSTLLSLIPRFYDPDSGKVLIDGCDLRDVRLRSLRQQIGIVTQETVLFNDSIRNNIAYGHPHASLEDIEAAAQKAHADRFIAELPEGYNTNVGERAMSLSGGQRQLITLARAILRDPPILILDEATSSLDVESESLIHRVLQGFVKGRTTLIVTHRFSTLELADRIVVMNEARIVDVGSHKELLKRCQLYSRLHQIHSAAKLSA
jgi:ABC-type multidrug transport system fused ATPase/permease subunit